MSRGRVTFDEKGGVEKYELALTEDEARQGWRAMMLAPDIETCRALLRGESVSLDSLRPEWVARFGLRHR